MPPTRDTQWGLNTFVTKPPETNKKLNVQNGEAFYKEESCSSVECAGVEGVRGYVCESRMRPTSFEYTFFPK